MREAGVNNAFDSHLYNSKLEESSITNFSLFLHYLALFAVIGLAVGISIILSEHFILFFLPLLLLPIVHAFIVSYSLGKEFDKGVGISLLISIPISTISYFNELKYGCFCILFCSCPPVPSYYHYPRYSALIGGFLLLIYCTVLQIRGKKARGFGVFAGLIISFVIFMAATVIGFWS